MNNCHSQSMKRTYWHSPNSHTVLCFVSPKIPLPVRGRSEETDRKLLSCKQLDNVLPFVLLSNMMHEYHIPIIEYGYSTIFLHNKEVKHPSQCQDKENKAAAFQLIQTKEKTRTV